MTLTFPVGHFNGIVSRSVADELFKEISSPHITSEIARVDYPVLPPVERKVLPSMLPAKSELSARRDPEPAYYIDPSDSDAEAAPPPVVEEKKKKKPKSTEDGEKKKIKREKPANDEKIVVKISKPVEEPVKRPAPEADDSDSDIEVPVVEEKKKKVKTEKPAEDGKMVFIPGKHVDTTVQTQIAVKPHKQITLVHEKSNEPLVTGKPGDDEELAKTERPKKAEKPVVMLKRLTEDMISTRPALKEALRQLSECDTYALHKNLINNVPYVNKVKLFQIRALKVFLEPENAKGVTLALPADHVSADYVDVLVEPAQAPSINGQQLAARVKAVAMWNDETSRFRLVYLPDCEEQCLRPVSMDGKQGKNRWQAFTSVYNGSDGKKDFSDFVVSDWLLDTHCRSSNWLQTVVAPMYTAWSEGRVPKAPSPKASVEPPAKKPKYRRTQTVVSSSEEEDELDEMDTDDDVSVTTDDGEDIDTEDELLDAEEIHHTDDEEPVKPAVSRKRSHAESERNFTIVVKDNENISIRTDGDASGTHYHIHITKI